MKSRVQSNLQVNCYDISSLIRKKLELKTCPSCQAGLARREVEHSQASVVFKQNASVPVISTYLSQCQDCGWWAVRELRADDALYYPPVEAFIVMDASMQGTGKRENDAEPWLQVLADKTYWENAVPIQSSEAIEIFGSAQMLLPQLNSLSGQGVFDKIKAIAPILFPILVIIGIAFFF